MIKFILKFFYSIFFKYILFLFHFFPSNIYEFFLFLKTQFFWCVLWPSRCHDRLKTALIGLSPSSGNLFAHFSNFQMFKFYQLFKILNCQSFNFPKNLNVRIINFPYFQFSSFPIFKLSQISRVFSVIQNDFLI